MEHSRNDGERMQDRRHDDEDDEDDDMDVFVSAIIEAEDWAKQLHT